MAVDLGLISTFLDSIPKDLLNRLTFYQDQINLQDKNLAMKLPSIAKRMSQSILTNLNRDEEIAAIYVVGKTTQFKDKFPQADIVLETTLGEFIPIGLKFCKQNSYVNTKNAGIRSFLSKYFETQENYSPFDQEELNKNFQEYYYKMGQQMYQKHQAHFLGEFDSQWTHWGHDHLPGNLPKEFHEFLNEYYFHTIQCIFEKIQKYHHSNPEQFSQNILPLLGLESTQMLQVFCFHQGTSLYNISEIQLLRWVDYQLSRGIELVPPKINCSFFEIRFSQGILQIRVKPMNTFTTPNVKINCSVKYTVLPS